MKTNRQDDRDVDVGQKQYIWRLPLGVGTAGAVAAGSATDPLDIFAVSAASIYQAVGAFIGVGRRVARVCRKAIRLSAEVGRAERLSRKNRPILLCRPYAS